MHDVVIRIPNKLLRLICDDDLLHLRLFFIIVLKKKLDSYKLDSKKNTCVAIKIYVQTYLLH